MNMIAHQRPCIDRGSGLLSQCSESSHKISSIRLVIDNPPLFNASNHHVVQGPWTIESCLPRHTFLPPYSLSVFHFVQLVNSVPHRMEASRVRLPSPAPYFLTLNRLLSSTGPVVASINSWNPRCARDIDACT